MIVFVVHARQMHTQSNQRFSKKKLSCLGYDYIRLSHKLVFIVVYSLCSFDHGDSVLCLWCARVLSGDDLSQLRVGKVRLTNPLEVR